MRTKEEAIEAYKDLKALMKLYKDQLSVELYSELDQKGFFEEEGYDTFVLDEFFGID